MRLSTISKSHLTGGGSTFAAALGATIRERRRRLGLSQAALGAPLSRAFISSVEHGRLSPSLGSLLLMAERLELPAWELLRRVNKRMTTR